MIRHLGCALAVACLGLAAGAGAASATTVDYSGDGSTVIVTGGDAAAHSVNFRLSADTAHDEILDPVGFTSYPGDCTVLSLTPVPTWISCPAHVAVQIDLGAGNDEVGFGGSQADCFNSYVVNLGDGANRASLHDNCPPAAGQVATITGGSGPDNLTGGNQGVLFLAAGGDDSVSGGSGDDVVHGGEGNDRLFGGAGDDQVLGEGGADAPNGGPGNDRLDGGAGNDELGLCSQCALSGNDTGGGADAYIGGPDVDKLWLDAHPGGMAISIDGVANDGVPGEGDDIGGDIEAIEGTNGNDTFVGSAGVDVFSGNGGNDDIHGAGGADDLYGGGGDDTIAGDAGTDKLQGGGGGDRVDGGAGADQLYGDVASCTVFCSLDADTLLARDGEIDRVDCGGGADAAEVDQSDVVAFCASVNRGTAEPPRTGPDARFALTTKGRSSVAKGVRATVSCPAACRFTVVLRLAKAQARRRGLGRKTVTIGSAAGRLAAAGAKTVRVTLTRKAKRKLRSAKSVPVKVKVTITGAGAPATTRTKAVTLKR